MITVKIGEVFVEIKADMTKLTTGLAAAKGQVQNATVGMSKHFQTMGVAMVAAGTMITAAFALTVKAAITEQKELAQVSTMLDSLSMKYMPEFAEGLDRLSIEFGESSATLSKGLYDILSASIEPAKALDVLAVASKAASAGITDTGIAADAITTILNSYGLEAEDAGKVSDQLFAIVKRGKTTFAELAPAIGKSAALASMAGLSFEDLGAAVATMTRAGISTDEAMTSINGVLNSFMKSSPEAIAAAKEFGVQLDKTGLQADGLSGIMTKLKDATNEQLASIFPNIRGLKGIAAAMSDAAGYASDYKLILESTGLTQEAFDKQSATLGFQLGRLKQAFGVLAEEIGAALLPTIELLTKGILAATIAIANFTKAHPTLTKAITLFGATLGVLVLAGGLITLAVLAFVKLQVALLALKGAFIAVKTAILAFSGPVGWIILAVGALTLAWITNFGKIRDFTITVVNKIKEALGWLWDKVIWVAEKLGLIKESTAGGGGVLGVFGDEAKEVGEKTERAAIGVDTLTTSIDGLETQTDETKTALNEFGQIIETFDEWVARLAEETKTRNEEIAASTQTLADTLQPIYDRLYEMSHTEEEIAIRNLTAQKDAQIAAVNALNLSADAQAAAIAKITELYNLEVGLIIAKLEEERKKLIEIATTENTSANERMAAIRKINGEYDTQIAKVNAVATATEESAKRQTAALQKIVDAQGKVTTVILPGGGTISTEPITAPNVGAEYYAPKLQHGTPYIPKTGLYQLHKGEAVIPKNQNTINKQNYSFSPTVNLTVSGGGNASNIAYEVKKVLDESIRQFRRSGFELVPGRG